MAKKKILLVDDESTNLSLLKQILEKDYSLAFAKNGLRALSLIEEVAPDLILLDVMMPDLNGWEVLKKLKSNTDFNSIPVIVQSSLSSDDDFHKGYRLGARYYVKKPIQSTKLLPLVKSAIQEHLHVKKLRESLAREDQALALTREWRLNYRTPEEAISISKLISKACPDSDKVLPGLLELLINAVEHGIADIGYQNKTDFLQEDTYKEELIKRLEKNENKAKFVSVYFKKNQNKISIRIEDPGKGFEWSKFLYFSIDRATDSHGRGVALAKAMSFDELLYSGRGNIVTAVIDLIPTN